MLLVKEAIKRCFIFLSRRNSAFTLPCESLNLHPFT